MSHHRIEIEHLSFRYPDGRLALNDVSLHVAPNEKLALVGPNGSGKTTLLLHLNGILRPSAETPARIEVAQLPVTDQNLGQIRAKVGLVFQNPDDQLFSPKVFDDVAFGPLHMGLPADEVRARVDSALSVVGLPEYHTRISHHLSLGEKKRIAIATVLSMDPVILVLDEPTAGLDPRARRQLIEWLQASQHQTMLVSTHDMRLAYELCSRVVVMDNGQIVANGPSQTILADKALMEKHGLESPF
jgi:cobalt/nickel transport system ATP-binding protein